MSLRLQMPQSRQQMHNRLQQVQPQRPQQTHLPMIPLQPQTPLPPQHLLPRPMARPFLRRQHNRNSTSHSMIANRGGHFIVPALCRPGGFAC